jgi:hypothetical protein
MKFFWDVMRCLAERWGVCGTWMRLGIAAFVPSLLVGRGENMLCWMWVAIWTDVAKEECLDGTEDR